MFVVLQFWYQDSLLLVWNNGPSYYYLLLYVVKEYRLKVIADHLDSKVSVSMWQCWSEACLDYYMRNAELYYTQIFAFLENIRPAWGYRTYYLQQSIIIIMQNSGFHANPSDADRIL